MPLVWACPNNSLPHCSLLCHHFSRSVGWSTLDLDGFAKRWIRFGRIHGIFRLSFPHYSYVPWWARAFFCFSRAKFRWRRHPCSDDMVKDQRISVHRRNGPGPIMPALSFLWSLVCSCQKSGPSHSGYIMISDALCVTDGPCFQEHPDIWGLFRRFCIIFPNSGSLCFFLWRLHPDTIAVLYCQSPYRVWSPAWT